MAGTEAVGTSRSESGPCRGEALGVGLAAAGGSYGCPLREPGGRLDRRWLWLRRLTASRRVCGWLRLESSEPISSCWCGQGRVNGFQCIRAKLIKPVVPVVPVTARRIGVSGLGLLLGVVVLLWVVDEAKISRHGRTSWQKSPGVAALRAGMCTLRSVAGGVWAQAQQLALMEVEERRVGAAAGHQLFVRP